MRTSTDSNVAALRSLRTLSELGAGLDERKAYRQIAVRPDRRLKFSVICLKGSGFGKASLFHNDRSLVVRVGVGSI